ncbi:D-galactarate dehydratase [Rhodovulum sp. YEN HP10]|uniref:D-galactarate dehydratase n=1 Tax=Rhodovulum sp. HP10 TaxID=3387397 RepID=UPI0039E138E9
MIEALPPEPGALASGAQDATGATAPAGLEEATAPVLGFERELGVTTASLGDPTDPGFWALTPLTDEIRRGRLADPVSGKSVQVELRPSGGASGAGTRVSLSAMQALEVPLISLTNLKVYASE